MKNILLLVHDDVGQEARLQAALDLTRLVNGHLICLDVAVPPPALVDDSAGSVVGVTLLTAELDRETANRCRLEQRLLHEDVSWEWQDTLGRLAPSLRHAARFADLIVVNRHLDSSPSPDMRAVAGDIIVRSDKPVLAVSDDCDEFDSRCAVIAWSGSPCAFSAMHHAIPLLQHCQHVFLTEVRDDAAETDIEEAAQYLSRYGIHARIERVSAGELEVGDILIDQARRHGAGFLVAGGYGHSRLSEALFGGVTRELLTQAPCPVFVAH